MNSDFRQKLSPRAIKEAEEAIRYLLTDCVRCHKIKFPNEPLESVNDHYLISTQNPDYAEAYGVVKGLSIACGSCCLEPDMMEWFQQLKSECWAVPKGT